MVYHPYASTCVGRDAATTKRRSSCNNLITASLQYASASVSPSSKALHCRLRPCHANRIRMVSLPYAAVCVDARLTADGCVQHCSMERTQIGCVRRTVSARIRGLCSWNFVRTAYRYSRPLPCAQFTQMPFITTHSPRPIRIQRCRKLQLTPNRHLPTSTFARARERNHSRRCLQVSHH